MSKNIIAGGMLSIALLFPIASLATAVPTHAQHKVVSHGVGQTKLININKASAKQLAILKHIGKKKAEAIVAYRVANGSFKSINDLTKVKGISQKIVNENKAQLQV